jgi:hypothetical protein
MPKEKVPNNVPKDSDIENELDNLILQWDKCIRETPSLRFSSNTYHYLSCQAYKDIVKLGRLALPSLIERMRKGDPILWHAVKDITNVNLDTKPSGQSLQELTQVYIEWWDQEGRYKFGHVH